MFDIECPHDAFAGLLDCVPVPEEALADLRNRLSGRERLYHGAFHLASMWDLHQRLTVLHPELGYLRGSFLRIASAIAFHDAVYDPKSPLNEVNSALLWVEANEAEDRDCAWVSGAILATKDHLAPRPALTDDDRLREWFVGLDLHALAAPPAVFDLNNALIRLEYAHLTEAEFRDGHVAFLHSLLGTHVIFRDPVLFDLFETDARRNIARRLQALHA